jgi:hypothetical protein
LPFVSDLHLQLSDPSLQTQQLLLQSSLFPLQGSDLLLDSAVLSLLEIEVSLHFLFNADEFIGKTLLDISGFHGENRLKCVLFRPENLHLFFMIVEFIGDVFDLLLR